MLLILANLEPNVTKGTLYHFGTIRNYKPKWILERDVYSEDTHSISGVFSAAGVHLLPQEARVLFPVERCVQPEAYRYTVTLAPASVKQ